MTAVTPYRSGLRPGRDGFGRQVRAEWTKFRTVRGWVAGAVAAALVTMLLGLFFAVSSHSSCSEGPVEVTCPAPPLGPDGEAVSDRFFFVHQPLARDGELTVRVTSMTGIITYPPPDHDEIVPGVVPWAKAGIIVKANTEQGSAYAAVMVTGAHGVRMQYDFTHDVAGRPGGVSARAPRWLRLTRSGDAITGYESADGTRWTEVGTTRLAGLTGTVQVGLFVNSPGDLTLTRGALGGSIAQGRFTQTTAVFDQVRLRGGAAGSAWGQDEVGDDSGQTDWERFHRANGLVESAGTYTVSGTGDIAPSTDGQAVERTLTGALAGLITMIVVAVVFVTAEYRRGLIRTTLLAAPRRGRAAVAKAVVIGAVAFAAGLAAAGISVVAGTGILRANGNVVLPVGPLTELRVIAGTGALFAAAAVFAMAVGLLFRRSVVAVTTAIAVVVLPYLLASASVLPLGLAQWLLRLTPAAGFAIQQSIPEYPQVVGDYAPHAGYFPLSPWAGLAVLCGYAVAALALAAVRLRRRDS